MEIRLGTIKIGEHKQELNFHDLITADEFELLKKYISEIHILKNNKRLKDIVVHNHNEFIEYTMKIIKEHSANPLSLSSMNKEKGDEYCLNLNRFLLNYLNSFLTLIDHYKTFISRKYGKSSNHIKQFEQFLSTCFDSVFAYRFLYKLRNYAQHCELPLRDIEFSASLNSDENSISGKLRLTFNPPYLLSSYDDWGKIVKKDLQDMNEELDLYPLMEELTKTVIEIWKQVNYTNSNEIVEAARYIKNNAGHLNKDGNEVLLFHNIIDMEDGSLKSFQTLTIPFDEIKLLNLY